MDDPDDAALWIPTHEITIEQTTAPYSREQILVMLVEDRAGEGGPAYTLEEWSDADNAAWGCDAAGEWHCEGNTTPGGRTDLTVAVRVPVYLARDADSTPVLTYSQCVQSVLASIPAGAAASPATLRRRAARVIGSTEARLVTPVVDAVLDELARR